MPKKPIVIPRFRSTVEEARWWDSRDGKRAATQLMKQAIEVGNFRRSKTPLKTVTMRLPVPDIEAAKDLAFRKGLPYQTYIKMLLHEAIVRERGST